MTDFKRRHSDKQPFPINNGADEATANDDAILAQNEYEPFDPIILPEVPEPKAGCGRFTPCVLPLIPQTTPRLEKQFDKIPVLKYIGQTVELISKHSQTKIPVIYNQPTHSTSLEHLFGNDGCPVCGFPYFYSSTRQNFSIDKYQPSRTLKDSVLIRCANDSLDRRMMNALGIVGTKAPCNFTTRLKWNKSNKMYELSPITQTELNSLLNKRTTFGKNRMKIEDTFKNKGESAGRRKCDKCGSDDIDEHMAQTRSADEPPTRFYHCRKCGKNWREYE